MGGNGGGLGHKEKGTMGGVGREMGDNRGGWGWSLSNSRTGSALSPGEDKMAKDDLVSKLGGGGGGKGEMGGQTPPLHTVFLGGWGGGGGVAQSFGYGSRWDGISLSLFHGAPTPKKNTKLTTAVFNQQQGGGAQAAPPLPTNALEEDFGGKKTPNFELQREKNPPLKGGFGAFCLEAKENLRMVEERGQHQ